MPTARLQMPRTLAPPRSPISHRGAPVTAPVARPLSAPRVTIVTDIEECRLLWQRVFPQERITDLWEVRACFQHHYRRPVCFVVAWDAQGIRGLLPLSWIAETASYGYFPGETWRGQTWLEQNRIFVRTPGDLARLLAAIPARYHLRYLTAAGLPAESATTVDEVGYRFLPFDHGCDMESYLGQFSHKRLKRLRRELGTLEDQGVTPCEGERSDFEHLVRLNVDRFGEHSYFADPRFRESFRRLMDLLAERGWLRLTTMKVGEEPIAVDLGCLYRNTYTLFAGGAHGAYPGVAKLINLHHMRRACAERMTEVDFLCGDFSWKSLFHLNPRPLYLLSSLPVRVGQCAPTAAGRTTDVR